MKASPPLHTRLNRQLLTLAMLGAWAGCNAWAAPTGASVTHGQASFNQQGNTLTIANSPNTIINWRDFSIASGETVRFLQQHSGSAVLNRVVGGSPSHILGALVSNGRVYLINPNGIVFGPGARVDVAGLVASSLQLQDQDFLAGRLNFSGSPGAPVRNLGHLSTPDGGHIYLIAPNAENSGIINTPNGDVILAAGHQVNLVDSSNPQLQVVLSAPEHSAINLGQILTAGGRTGIYGALLQQSGRISADSAIQGEGGRIFLKASGNIQLDRGSQTSARGGSGGQITVEAAGDSRVAGLMDAGGDRATGGTVHVLGQRVAIEAGSTVETSAPLGGGQILVGGDYRGENPAIRNATQTRLDAGARLGADATVQGNGGRIIVWGNETTQAHGEISARGGPQGGDGGFVETSAKYLYPQGARVDTRAPLGRTGMWLLDPVDVQIDNSTPYPTMSWTGGNWALTGTPVSTSVILASELQTQLAGSSITIDSTAGAPTGTASPGSITVLTPLTWSSANTLTLKSTGDIAINAGITAANGKLSAQAGGSINVTGASITTAQTSLVASGPIQLTNTTLNSNSLTLNGASVSQDPNSVITAGTLMAKSTAAAGITLTSSTNQITTFQGQSTSTGPINLTNSGNLTVSSISTQGGNVTITTTGNFTSQGINTQGGNVSITADGNINNQPSGIDACGTATGCMSTVQLDAGSSISTALIKAGVSVTLDAGEDILDGDGSANNIVSGGANPVTLSYIAGGNVDLDAWGVSTTGSAAGTVNIRTTAPPPPPPPPPTLDQCIANPALSGCSSVLPSLDSCTANPGQTGCSVVLPSLDACVKAPATPGCSAVLPTLDSCTANPSQPGCSAVLPNLDACITAPATPGCSAVLPSLDSCTANPGQTGCTVVLPSLSACMAAPSTPGCSAVLPSLSSCTTTPALTGCSVVLPSLDTCISAPATPGCSAVLPPLANCTADPALPGCPVVLPPASTCSTDPNLPGCTVVLPPSQLLQVEQQQQTSLTQATEQNIQGCNTTQGDLLGFGGAPAPGTREDIPLAPDNQNQSGTSNEEPGHAPAFCN